MDIEYYRKCKNVDRLALQTIHRGYNLMEHMYGVAILFKKFANLEEVRYGLEEFDLVLHHDLIEVISIDLPWNVKNLNKVTKRAWEIIEEEVIKKHPQLEQYSDKNIKNNLNEKQYALFKICDYLDLWIFIKEEIALGNVTKPILEVETNCIKLISDICNKHGFFEVLNFMKNYEA